MSAANAQDAAVRALLACTHPKDEILRASEEARIGGALVVDDAWTRDVHVCRECGAHRIIHREGRATEWFRSSLANDLARASADRVAASMQNATKADALHAAAVEASQGNLIGAVAHLAPFADAVSKTLENESEEVIGSRNGVPIFVARDLLIGAPLEVHAPPPPSDAAYMRRARMQRIETLIDRVQSLTTENAAMVKELAAVLDDFLPLLKNDEGGAL